MPTKLSGRHPVQADVIEAANGVPVAAASCAEDDGARQDCMQHRREAGPPVVARRAPVERREARPQLAAGFEQPVKLTRHGTDLAHMLEGVFGDGEVE